MGGQSTTTSRKIQKATPRCVDLASVGPGQLIYRLSCVKHSLLLAIALAAKRLMACAKKQKSAHVPKGVEAVRGSVRVPLWRGSGAVQQSWLEDGLYWWSMSLSSFVRWKARLGEL